MTVSVHTCKNCGRPAEKPVMLKGDIICEPCVNVLFSMLDGQLKTKMRPSFNLYKVLFGCAMMTILSGLLWWGYKAIVETPVDVPTAISQCEDSAKDSKHYDVVFKACMKAKGLD